MAASNLTTRMHLRLAQLETLAQMRDLRMVQGTNLCSNDYLGLSSDPSLKASVAEAVLKCGRVGATGSRLLSGHHSAWEQLEEEFAEFAGTEAALFFNSGYAANVGLLSSLLGAQDIVFSDAMNHASIIDGIRLSRAQKIVYRHANLNSLEEALRRHSGQSGARVIVTETIFSMDGDRAPLAEIFRLASQYSADVIVDEAHATGASGPQGRGLTAELGLKALAVVHTCGKALASVGAFVCGTRKLKRFLINHSRSFIFSTALPPYLADQVRTALRLAGPMEAERRHLAMLGATLRQKLAQLGYDCGSSSSHIVPMIAGSNEAALRLAAALEEQGFAVRAVRPPTVPPGTSRLRLSLTARLTTNDLEHFATVVSSLPQPNIHYV